MVDPDQWLMDSIAESALQYRRTIGELVITVQALLAMLDPNEFRSSEHQRTIAGARDLVRELQHMEPVA